MVQYHLSMLSRTCNCLVWHAAAPLLFTSSTVPTRTRLCFRPPQPKRHYLFFAFCDCLSVHVQYILPMQDSCTKLTAFPFLLVVPPLPGGVLLECRYATLFDGKAKFVQIDVDDNQDIAGTYIQCIYHRPSTHIDAPAVVLLLLPCPPFPLRSLCLSRGLVLLSISLGGDGSPICPPILGLLT